MMLVGTYQVKILHVQGNQFRYEIRLADEELLACGMSDDSSELNGQIIHALMTLIRIDLAGFNKEQRGL